MSPFLDSEAVIAHQEEHGVPMCMRTRLFVPPGKDPESFVEIPELLDVEGTGTRKLWRAIIGFEQVAHGLARPSCPQCRRRMMKVLICTTACSYGRTPAVVMIDGRSVGDALVSEGVARTWSGRREPWC